MQKTSRSSLAPPPWPAERISMITGMLTIVSGSGILTPLKKTLEWNTCWCRGIRSPEFTQGEVIGQEVNHKGLVIVVQVLGYIGKITMLVVPL